MRFHPDVLAAHAQFGGDLEEMQRLYDGAKPMSANEKAAPIPEDVLAPFRRMAECTEHTDVRDGEIVMRLQHPETMEWVVLTRADFRAILADRAARPAPGVEEAAGRDSPVNLSKRVLAIREHLRHERADGVDLGTLSVVARTLTALASLPSAESRQEEERLREALSKAIEAAEFYMTLAHEERADYFCTREGGEAVLEQDANLDFARARLRGGAGND